jgi:hypothetical protein
MLSDICTGFVIPLRLVPFGGVDHPNCIPNRFGSGATGIEADTKPGCHIDLCAVQTDSYRSGILVETYPGLHTCDVQRDGGHSQVGGSAKMADCAG